MSRAVGSKRLVGSGKNNKLQTLSSNRTSNQHIQNQRNLRIAPNNSNVNRNPSHGEVVAGGGQVQLHRSSISQKKRQSSMRNQSHSHSVAAPVQKSQQPHSHQMAPPLQQNQHNAVISMDEVMEDLRVLEQQQRDSQRNLAAIKVAKQHKLDQRSSLDAKLSALKYSNGEGRFQLNHARKVLSKSQRELAAAKLRSERSNDNLNKFDEKLKKTLSTVRALHSKRRKLDEAMVRLENYGAILENNADDIVRLIKSTVMQVDNARHRETLLVKAVQDSKVKKQTFAERTSQVRGAISSLESELTATQQTEAAVKMSLDQKRMELQDENERFCKTKDMYLRKRKETEVQRSDLESSIRELTHDVESKGGILKDSWEKCIIIQNVEGLDASISVDVASLDVDAIRVNLNGEKATLALREEEVLAAEGRSKALEAELVHLQEKSNALNVKNDDLVLKVTADRQREDRRVEERRNVVQELQSSRDKLGKLKESLDSLNAEKNLRLLETEDRREHADSSINTEKDKLVQVTLKMEVLNKECEDAESELERETCISQEGIAKAKMAADEAGEAMTAVQKRANDMPISDVDEHLTAVEEEEVRRIDVISSKQQQILSKFPCLASVDLSSDDPHASTESQIESALSGLRDFCNTKVKIASEAREESLAEMKKKYEEEEKEKLQVEAENAYKARIEAENLEMARVEADNEARARAEADNEARARVEATEKMYAQEEKEKKKNEAQESVKSTSSRRRRGSSSSKSGSNEEAFVWNDEDKKEELDVESLQKVQSSTRHSGRFIASTDKDYNADHSKRNENLNGNHGGEEDTVMPAKGRRAKTARSGYGSRNTEDSKSRSRSTSRDLRAPKSRADAAPNSAKDSQSDKTSSRLQRAARSSSDFPSRSVTNTRERTCAGQALEYSGRSTSVTPKRVDKVRFQDRPTVANTDDLDKAMSISMESSSTKRPHSIISKTKSRDRSKVQRLDIFAQSGDVVTSKKGRHYSLSRRSETSSREKSHDNNATKELSSSKVRDMSLSRRSESSSKAKIDFQSDDQDAVKKVASSKVRSSSLPRRSGSSSKDKHDSQRGHHDAIKKVASSKVRSPSLSRRSESSSKANHECQSGHHDGTKKATSSKVRTSTLARRSESSSKNKRDSQSGDTNSVKKITSSKVRALSSSKVRVSSSSSRSEPVSKGKKLKNISSSKADNSASKKSNTMSVGKRRVPLSQSTSNTTNSRRRKTSVGSKRPRSGMSSLGGDFSFLE